MSHITHNQDIYIVNNIFKSSDSFNISPPSSNWTVRQKILYCFLVIDKVLRSVRLWFGAHIIKPTSIDLLKGFNASFYNLLLIL